LKRTGKIIFLSNVILPDNIIHSNPTFFKGLNYFGNLSRLSKENLFLIYGGLKNYRRTAAKVLSWKNYREIAEY